VSNHRRRHPHLDRGRQFEVQLFGRYADFKSVPPDMDFCQAIVRAYQQHPADWDPFDPPKDWANRLLRAVRAHIPSDQAPHLGLYVSLGTSLDWWYGVDAFFALGFGIATLDITTAAVGSKGDRLNVHFVFYSETLNEDYEDRCRQIAAKVLTPQRGLRKAFEKFDPPSKNPSSPNPLG
jgi:hypothetical protein